MQNSKVQRMTPNNKYSPKLTSGTSHILHKAKHGNILPKWQPLLLLYPLLWNENAMKLLHRTLDYFLINYLVHFKKAHPCSPIFIGDYSYSLGKIQTPYEEYKNNTDNKEPIIPHITKGRGLWYPSPRPLPWGDDNVNTVKIINLCDELETKRNTVLWVHGFLMDDPLISFWALKAIKKIIERSKTKASTSHLLFQLPLHYNRKLHFRGTEVGGEWLFQESPIRMLEVIKTSMIEINAFLSWWLHKFSGQITVVGISLGGAISGWLPVIRDFEKRLHLTLLVPAIDLYNSFLKSPLVQPLRQALITSNSNPDIVDSALQKWNPIYYPSQWEENVKIIGGSYDALLPLQGIVWASTPSPWKEQPIGKWKKVWVKSVPYGHSSWSLPYLGKSAQDTLAKVIAEISFP